MSPAFVREFFLTTPDPATGRPIHVGYLLKADETTWLSRFSNGVRVDIVGSLVVHFVIAGAGVGGLRVESMEFDSRGHEEFVVRDAIVSEMVEKLYDTLSGNAVSATGSDAGIESSPGIGGGGRGRGARRGSGAAGGASTRRRSATKDEVTSEEKSLGSERVQGMASVMFEKVVLPSSPVGSFGITEMGMRCLEVCRLSNVCELKTYKSRLDCGVCRSAARPHWILSRLQRGTYR
jgi:hypothetical protein